MKRRWWYTGTCLKWCAFTNLGLPDLDEVATGSRAAHLQHFLYRGLALPLVALAGLTFMTYKNMHGDKIAERIAAQKSHASGTQGNRRSGG